MPTNPSGTPTTLLRQEVTRNKQLCELTCGKRLSPLSGPPPRPHRRHGQELLQFHLPVSSRNEWESGVEGTPQHDVENGLVDGTTTTEYAITVPRRPPRTKRRERRPGTSCASTSGSVTRWCGSTASSTPPEVLLAAVTLAGAQNDLTVQKLTTCWHRERRETKADLP